MSKLLKSTVIGLTLLGTVAGAEAMPAASNLTAPAVGTPQIEKTVVIVRRPVIRRRVIVRRPFVRPLRRRPAIIIR